MKKFLNDLIGQSFTLLGMLIAWVVLEGSAKIFVGWSIIATLTLHIATYPLRKDDK